MVSPTNVDNMFVAIRVVSDELPSQIVAYSKSGYVFSSNKLGRWCMFYVLEWILGDWNKFQFDVDAEGDPRMEVLEYLRDLLHVELFLKFRD